MKFLRLPRIGRPPSLRPCGAQAIFFMVGLLSNSVSYFLAASAFNWLREFRQFVMPLSRVNARVRGSRYAR